MTILIPVISISILGLLFGLGLGFAAKKLQVKKDKKTEMILDILPGSNCGACGHAGCLAYAENIALHDGDICLCAPGGEEVIKKLEEVTGRKAGKVAEQMAAHLMCKGGDNIVKRTSLYTGIRDCNAAVLVDSGNKECPYGCLGYGSCVKSCKFDAMRMDKNGLPLIDKHKCTACGACVTACPNDLIELVPRSAYYFIECKSRDKGARVRKYCKVGCIACSICVKLNEGKGIEMKNNLAVVDYKIFSGEKETAKKCPTGTIGVDE